MQDVGRGPGQMEGRFARNRVAPRWTAIAVSVAGGLLVAAGEVSATTGTKPCSIEAAGGACLFDITANAAGSLSACTTAAAAGARWRATIVEANTAGAASAVGSGVTGSCTGPVARPVAAGGKYIVAITYDGPVSATFPASATVSVSGPFAHLPDPRPSYPGDQVSTCTTDPQTIACGADITCDLTAGDVDVFKFDVPANGVVAMKVCGASGARWDLYSPAGTSVSYGYGFGSSPLLAAAGRYAASVSNVYATRHTYGFSMLGISSAYHCGVAIADGQQKTSSFSGCSDLDGYTFIGQTGQVYSIRISGCFGVRWDLYDPLGRSVTYGYGASTTPALSASGTYTIVTYNVYGTSCPYTLTLNRVSAMSAPAE